MRSTARHAATLALALGLLAAPHALATDGNLYPLPPSDVVAPGPSILAGDFQRFTLHAPPMYPAPAGDHLAITGRAPAGSEVASIHWAGSRSAAPSHMGVIFAAGFQELQQLADADLIQAPGSPRQFDWAVPAGRSQATLRFRQMETRNQHERYYWLDNVHARIRDVAPPTCALGAIPGWITSRGPAQVTWAAGDNFGDDGIAGQGLILDDRPIWAGGPGYRGIGLPLDTIADGDHGLRLTVAGDGTAGCVSAARLRIDRTPPEVAAPNATAGPGDAGIELDWNAGDAASGLDRVEIELNEAPSGSIGGAWRTLHATTASSGSVRVAVPAGIADGAHRIRARAWDRAGHQSSALAEPVVIDRTAPTVAADFSESGGAIDLEATLGDAGSGLASVSVEVLLAGAWRPIGALPPREGVSRHRLTPPELGPGKHTLRLRVRDLAGNEAASEPHRGVVFLTDQSRSAPSRAARVATGRLTLAVAGGRIARRAPRESIVKGAVPGRPIRLRGQLTDAGGGPLAEHVIEARERTGRIIGQTATDAAGRFAMTIRPLAGGAVRIGSPIDATFVLPQSRPALTILANGNIGLNASSLRARADGDPIVFSGRVAPSPRSVRIGRKSVILEWRDPLRESWRPVVTARLRPDGTYRIAWRFRTVGLTIPIRVRVPRDGGWPVPTLRSRVIAVRVTG